MQRGHRYDFFAQWILDKRYMKEGQINRQEECEDRAELNKPARHITVMLLMRVGPQYVVEASWECLHCYAQLVMYRAAVLTVDSLLRQCLEVEREYTRR